ncbi:MAG TPA: amino acid ABC transporter permease [Rhizobiaceae bacterium]|nr:amino acid ABC transporter permease [Rhizobiaceae bacterium]
MTQLEIIAGIFQGFQVTATVTLLGLLYAVPFAFFAGVLQYFLTGFRQTLVTAVIEFWRSSPVIVLLFVFYYSLPAFGISLSSMTVASLVLGLNIGGYGSQAVRAALQALPRGQVEAGMALGLKRWTILTHIELPQAIRSMIPTFMNQLIQLIKGTALVSLIALTDMTYRAKELAQIEYNPVGIYAGLLFAYLVLCYPITILGRLLEKRANPSGVRQRDL